MNELGVCTFELNVENINKSLRTAVEHAAKHVRRVSEGATLQKGNLGSFIVAE